MSRTASTTLKQYRIAKMEGAQILFADHNVNPEALVPAEKARIFRYAKTADKYAAKMNAKARFAAMGTKSFSKNPFYVEQIG